MRNVGVTTLLVLIVVCPTWVLAQQKRTKTIRRAKPPTFSLAETEGIFYQDVFADGGLVGERPADLTKAAAAPTTAPGSGSSSSNGGAAEGLYPWKSVISAVAIENEVKALKLSVDANVTTPGKFASGGNKRARRDFSMLTLLFAIAAEYDGEVRWKNNAPEIRDTFAQTAANAKVGTEQAFNEAVQRKQDLQDLVGGGVFNSVKKSDAKTTWETLIDRVPLMQRLELSHQGSMQPAVANIGQFQANTEKLVHEANVVAAIAEVLVQEGMEDSADEGYSGHARKMKKGAQDLIEAVKLNNYDNATQAVGAIGQACSQCHADWR